MATILATIKGTVNDGALYKVDLVSSSTSGIQIEHSVNVTYADLNGPASGFNSAVINAVKQYFLTVHGVQNEPGEKTLLLGGAV